MTSTFRQRRRVEFYETDMAGIVHFSNFFRFMESTEHAFFRSLGLHLHHEGPDGESSGGMSGWARAAASCEFRAPLMYMDEVEIELTVREKRSSTISYDFEFTRVADRNGPIEPELSARGSLRVVHVTGVPGKHMKAVEMPADVARLVEPASAPAPAPAREGGTR